MVIMCVLHVSLITVSPCPRVSLHVKSSRDILDINDSGALASLDISKNSIGSAQEAIIKQTCAGRSIKCAL